MNKNEHMTVSDTLNTLRCCADGDCFECKLRIDKQDCQQRLLQSTAALIEDMQKEKEYLVDFAKGYGYCFNCEHGISCFYDDSDCGTCKNRENCKCTTCHESSNWVWADWVV